MAENNTFQHSLSTEIQMLFKTGGVQNVAGDVEELSDKVYKLTEPVKALKQAFVELNGSPVKNLVNTLENFSLDSVQVNAGNLRKVLENKIASAITKSKIEFIGDEGTERYPFKIPMGKEFWEKNEKNITEALAKSFSNFVVDVKDIPPLDNTEILKEFQAKFNEQIVELIKDEDIFSLYRLDPKNQLKRFKYKRKFNLDDSAVNEIMGAIERQFVTALSDPNNIELESMPKLKISSVELKQAMSKIQQSIGDIDKLVGVESDALKDLPNIEEKLLKFRSNLDKMIREINTLAIQLDSLTFGKVTEKDIKQSLSSIQKLKDTVIKFADGWVDDVIREMSAEFDTRSDLSKFKTRVAGLNEHFSNVLNLQMDLLDKQITSIQTELESSASIGGKEAIKGVKIDITEALVKLIQNSLPVGSDIPIDMDISVLDSTIAKWSAEFNNELNKELYNLVTVLTGGFETIFKAVSTHADLMINSALVDIDTMNDGNVSVFSGTDLDMIKEQLRTQLNKYMTEAVTSASSRGDWSKIYTTISDGVTEAFSVYLGDTLEGLKGISSDDFSVVTTKLHPQVKKALASAMEMSVGEFTRAFPQLKGSEARDTVMQQNVQLVLNAVNDLINSSVKDTISSYKSSIGNLKFNPDASLIDFIGDKMMELQDAVVSKARHMVRDQFKFLTDEIREMNLDAKSLGYRPTKAFMSEVAKAGGIYNKDTSSDIIKAIERKEMTIQNASMRGAEVKATGLEIDSSDVRLTDLQKLVTRSSSVVVEGQVVDLNVDKFPTDKIISPIRNYLSEGYPFSINPEITPHLVSALKDLTMKDFSPVNMFKNGYNPLDLSQMIPGLTGDPIKESAFKGITANMAKYFLVGYMMKLPIKALTEATKVASNLDYHVAKAKQNILIKDPDMESAAQKAVYERYQLEGLDTKSPQFKEDIATESRNFRNIMKYEMTDYLLNISKAYYQEIADVGRFYSIASRRSKDPYEALMKTREIAKLSAVEEDLDVDFAATGMEALGSQWGVSTGNLPRYTNMLLKTAMLSNTTVNDLLMAQRDTAAMFKSRLAGIEDEQAFATSMALSSMFVEATGKSGRESGTFWKNILQRPYVKDSRKFLQEVSQLKGFEHLSPYITNADGDKVQKDFLTMFSDILDTAIKVDDPSAMTVLSEIFPMRTIGGAESVTALIDDLKIDLQKSIDILKDLGEIDSDATMETLGTKEVIDKYIANILKVTDEDIGMYLAGLQDTTEFDKKGLQTQWQSTVYGVFSEFKEENSMAMTYLTAVLRKFEENSDKLAGVISIFAKLGVGLLGESILGKIAQQGKDALLSPNDLQRSMAEKYLDLQTSEKSLMLRKYALEEELKPFREQIDDITTHINTLQEEREQINQYILDRETKKGLTHDDYREIDNAKKQRAMYDDQLMRLRATQASMKIQTQGLETELAGIDESYMSTIGLGSFLKGSMGARSVDELKDSFANYIKNDLLYSELAPFAMRGKLNRDDSWYSQLQQRKTELENNLISQQKGLLEQVAKGTGKTSAKELENILGSNYGDTFYAMEHRITPETAGAMRKLTDHFGEEYSGMRKSFEKTYKELDSINSELLEINTDRLEIERAIFEAERPNITGVTTLSGGVKVNQTEAKSTAQKVSIYRDLLPATGINVEGFEQGLDRLAGIFREGKIDVNEYETSLRDIASQLGIADKDFDGFKTTIYKLNDEVRKGKKEIYDYIATLDIATTKGMKFQSPSSVARKMGDVEGSQIADTKSVSSGATGLGVAALLGGKFLKRGTAKGLMSKVGAGSIGRGAVAVGKGLATKLPHLASTLLVVSALGSAISGFTERSMTDAERLSMESNRLEKLINSSLGWKINEDDNLLKSGSKRVGSFIHLGASGLFNQLNRMMGGTAPSFKETMGIRSEVLSNPDIAKKDLSIQLKEQYEVELKRYKANYERQLEALNKNPFIDPLTGSMRTKGDSTLLNLPLEDLMNFLDKKLKELNRGITESDSAFTKEKVRLLLSGLSNNSTEMRNIIKEHLNRNIQEMTRLVDELKEYLPNLVPGTENYAAMKLQIMDLENKIAEGELQKFETDYSAYDEIMEKYSRKSSLIQSRYDIKKYDMLLSGIKKDSSAIKQIEKRMGEEQASLISGIQVKLDGLKQQYADKPEQREKILIQIQQLEADKKKILADIKEKMNEGLSTFNLPSDIKPITYYEAMTRGDTHKNVSIQSGKTEVNIMIDKMSGGDDDIDRLSKVVTDAVNQAQKNFVRQFSNDVKSGMGNSYYSWNNY